MTTPLPLACVGCKRELAFGMASAQFKSTPPRQLVENMAGHLGWDRMGGEWLCPSCKGSTTPLPFGPEGIGMNEREQIVAWLRKQRDPVERIDDRLNWLIDSIEAGDHLPLNEGKE